MAVMKPITNTPVKEGDVPKRAPFKREKRPELSPEQQEEIRKQLNKGEYLLKDGRFMYRAPKSDYNGSDKPPTITAYSLDELRKKEKELFLSKKLVVDVKSDVRELYDGIIDRHIMQVRSLEMLHNCLKQMFQLCVDDQMILISPVDRAMDQINRAAQKKEKIQKTEQ